ncbi:hypothetical protein L3X07_04175 [Levilactobacillus brevis]|nr:hypothetical protein [Levilactobacillus brevis]
MIPYQVDLRLHGPVVATNVVQVANLTGEMLIPLTVQEGERLADIVSRTQTTISHLREELAYLPPLVQLSRMSRALPPELVRRLAGKHRAHAAISFANFGHIDHTRLNFGSLAVTQIYFAGAYRTMPTFK